MATQEQLQSQGQPQGSDDLEAVRRKARELERAGQLDEAIGHWRQLESLAVEDAESSRMIAALAVRQSRVRAGLEFVSRPSQGDQSRKSKVESRKFIADVN